MPVRIRFVQHASAAKTLVEIARPGLERAAALIGPAIVAHVPVVRGDVQRTYRPSVRPFGDDVAVELGSPFWHWLEYGTAHSPAYRPVENGVRSVGLRWLPL